MRCLALDRGARSVEPRPRAEPWLSRYSNSIGTTTLRTLVCTHARTRPQTYSHTPHTPNSRPHTRPPYSTPTLARSAFMGPASGTPNARGECHDETRNGVSVQPSFGPELPGDLRALGEGLATGKPFVEGVPPQGLLPCGGFVRPVPPSGRLPSDSASPVAAASWPPPRERSPLPGREASSGRKPPARARCRPSRPARTPPPRCARRTGAGVQPAAVARSMSRGWDRSGAVAPRRGG
jgi:hypothetical protein